MTWRLIYEIDTTGGGAQFLPFIYVGLAVLAVALGSHVWARRKGQRSGTAIVLAIFGLLIGVLGYGVNTWDQGRLARHLVSGDTLQVEGPVIAHQIWREGVSRASTDRSPKFRHWETVTVGGVQFIWSPGAQEPAFTNAQNPPFPFRDGVLMRITYVDDVPGEAHQRRIVRVEVSEGSDGELTGTRLPSMAPGRTRPR